LKNTDARGAHVLLLGYEWRGTRLHNWKCKDWGRKAVPLHELPHNRMVKPGMLHVRGYKGFLGLVALTDAGEQTLKVAAEVAGESGIPFGDVLGAMQFETVVYAYTPPIVTAVRSLLCPRAS